ncbi:hypothetical protein HLB44_01660 [Aquincola sp. S2]|uniref:Uncharacterized protein n=1 Tax=Pseudaquabacterium terrae TaxID=2732868 RepID=A0ABX2EBF5_9BURK|nr:hypothetical protein [Aquabacterium terrae]NRF65682.1 hypothetical protein [Aquabacterium terrae]
MLIIRRAQLDALEQSVQAPVRARLQAMLIERHGAVSAPAEPFERVVREAMRLAASRGTRYVPDVLALAEHLLLGAEAD